MISRAAMSDVYEDQSACVERVARRFARKYHRDPEETIAEANYHFVEAVRTFDGSTGTTVGQRIGFLIERRLLDTLRMELDDQALLKRVDMPLELATSGTTAEFDADEFKSDLSDDARAVVELILETPQELFDQLRSDKKPSPASVRRCLGRYLKNSLGWAASQVREAFNELRDVMS